MAPPVYQPAVKCFLRIAVRAYKQRAYCICTMYESVESFLSLPFGFRSMIPTRHLSLGTGRQEAVMRCDITKSGSTPFTASQKQRSSVYLFALSAQDKTLIRLTGTKILGKTFKMKRHVDLDREKRSQSLKKKIR